MTCAECGTDFEPKRHRRDARFCRPACRTRWHAARRDDALVEIEGMLAAALARVRDLARVAPASEGEVDAVRCRR
jgi:hypothetical protein